MRHTYDRSAKIYLAPVISSLRIVKEQARHDDRVWSLLNPVSCQEESGLRSNQAQSIWWSQADSNRRPSACKADALPAELWPLTQRSERSRDEDKHLSPHLTDLVGLGGVEPPTSPLSGVRSNQLSYRPVLNVVSSAGNRCGHSRRGFASCD